MTPLKSGDRGGGDWQHINKVAAGADQTSQGHRVAREYLDARRRLITPIGGGGGAGAQMFIIKTLSNADYFVANTYDGTTRGSASINIAKSPRLRPSVTSETIDGVAITYSGYTSDNARVASDGTSTENQVAFPRYVALASGTPAVNDMSIVFAVPAVTGLTVSGVPVAWVEVSPARVWARKYAQ